MWSPRLQGRHEREVASLQTPSRHVHYNPEFACVSSEPVSKHHAIDDRPTRVELIRPLHLFYATGRAFGRRIAKIT